MSFTLTFTEQVRTPQDNLSAVVAVSADGVDAYTGAVATATVNQEVDFGFTLTAVKGYYLLSDQDLTLKTNGTRQVNTATVVGNCSGNGNAAVIVTAAGMTGTPRTVSVALTTADTTASLVAGHVRTALAADVDVAAFFTVSGTGANVVLTAIQAAANDGTMNIDIDNDTCSGLTDEPTSTATTAGVAYSDTISLQAGKPLGWYTGGYFTNKFTVDVTKVNITNASGATANINFVAVMDKTP